MDKDLIEKFRTLKNENLTIEQKINYILQKANEIDQNIQTIQKEQDKLKKKVKITRLYTHTFNVFGATLSIGGKVVMLLSLFLPVLFATGLVNSIAGYLCWGGAQLTNIILNKQMSKIQGQIAGEQFQLSKLHSEGIVLQDAMDKNKTKMTLIMDRILRNQNSSIQDINEQPSYSSLLYKMQQYLDKNQRDDIESFVIDAEVREL